MNIIDLLERHEGLKLTAYQDSLGYWTIGIGTLIDSRKGGGITIEEARYLCSNRIEKLNKDLDHQFPDWRKLSPVRRLVIQDMAYQLGVTGLMGFRKFIEYLQVGNYQLAATEMLDSRWASQTPNRANELSHMMREDETPWTGKNSDKR